MSPTRLAAAVPDVHSEFMVFPGYKLGSLQIVDLATTEHHVSSAPVTINAHQGGGTSVALFRPEKQPQYRPGNRPKVPFEKDTGIHFQL